MKKIIIFAAALAAMTACNKSVFETAAPSEGFGYINLGISADAEMVVTKTPTTPSTTALANYTVTLKQGETEKWKKKYSKIVPADWKVAAGNYIVEVENLTVTEAYDNTDSSNPNGKLRLKGSQSVEVKAGQKAPCTVNCTAANSKVTFTTDNNFGNVFTISATTLEVKMGDRTVSYESLGTDHANATPAYFEAGDVTWTLSTKVGETTKTYTPKTPLKLVAGQWTKVTFSSSTTDGQITLTITVDETMTIVEVPEKIDPLETTTNTPAGEPSGNNN